MSLVRGASHGPRWTLKYVYFTLVKEKEVLIRDKTLKERGF